MLKYFIKTTLVFLISMPLISQETQNEILENSQGFKEKYGLRFGLDLSKLGRTAFEKDYLGFELAGDYRLTKRLYIAGELGFEEKATETDFLESNASGSYFKVGVDFNLYRNWLGMENLIFTGFRAGIGSFKQSRDRYTIYDANNQTWGQINNNESVEFSGLTAGWIELLFGVKAELFNNLFLGLNLQLKARLSETEVNNFENIYIPGFGRTYDSSKIGTGFSYTLSYLIPIYKKSPKSKENKEVLDAPTTSQF